MFIVNYILGSHDIYITPMYLFHSEKKAKNFVKRCKEVLNWINDNRESYADREYDLKNGFFHTAIKIIHERKIPESDVAARRAVYDELVAKDKQDWEAQVKKKMPRRLLTTYQLMAKFPELQEPNNTQFSYEELEVIDE